MSEDALSVPGLGREHAQANADLGDRPFPFRVEVGVEHDADIGFGVQKPIEPATLLTTRPIAPSGLWAHRKITVRAKRGSRMPGIAISSLPERLWSSEVEAMAQR